jgi:hypothetical protein
LTQGLKLAVFGGTPMLLAGIFNAIPALSIIGILVAFYALYVMYLGLPVLMKNPKEKTIVYMVVLILASIIAGVVLSAVTSAFTPSMGGMGMRGGDATITTPMGEIKVNSNTASGAKNAPAQATISTPAGNATITTTPGAASAPDTASITIKTPEGEVKIDAQKMEAFAKQMEEMAKKMEQSKK